MTTWTSAPTGRMAKLFRALSDEKRLRIVELLRGGEKCVCDLQGAVDAGQSLLSFHLKTLKEAGLVDDRRAGRWAFYSLNADAFAEVEGFVAALRGDAEASGGSTCCG